MLCARCDHEGGFHPEKRGKCLTAGCACPAFGAAGEGGVGDIVSPDAAHPQRATRLPFVRVIGQFIGQYRRKVAG
jgi:hypothetical protein